MFFIWVLIWVIGIDSIIRKLMKKLNIVKIIILSCYYFKIVVFINVNKVMR